MLVWRAARRPALHGWRSDGWLPAGRSRNLTAPVLMAGVWGCGGVKQKKKNKKKQKVKVKDQHMMRATGTKVGMSGTIGTG